MSFTNTLYQSDAGSVYKIRISEDKADLGGAGAVATAITDPNVEVIASEGGRKKFGIHARGVKFSRTVGIPPESFKKYIFIPCMTKTIQNELLAEANITYKTLVYDNPTSVAER